MRLLAPALAAALLAATAALAQDATPPDEQAQVTARPTAADIGAVWPRDAAGKPVDGRVFLVCKVSAAGVVSDCQTARETPSGAGLGQAALKLAPKFKVAPAKRDGRPVDSQIVTPLYHFAFDTAPDWVRRPTAAQLLGVHPSAARGRAGRAVINCLVSIQGVLVDCVPVSEEPPGLGFGSAAVAITPQLLMRPAQRAGKPVVAIANIPIKWEAGAPATPDNSKKVVSPVSVWLEAPTAADVVAAYPDKARAQKLAGRATVACDFTPSGRVTSCETISEEPKNMGFGAAAKQLAKKFVAKAPEGQRITSAMVQLPFTFEPSMLDGQEPMVGKPAWAGIPNGDEMKAALANLPKNRGAVRVMLNCKIEQQGLLSGCRVESEQPAGEGFGQAALSLSGRFRLSTWANDGLPIVGGRVRIPLRFDTDAPAPAPAAKP